MNAQLGRSTSFKKKRKDLPNRANMSSNIFKSLDLKKKSDITEASRGLSNSISRFENSTFSLTNSGHKTSLAMYDCRNIIHSSKPESKKTLFITSQKNKDMKSRTKPKNFKLFKKRNLNAKLTKKLKFSEISGFSPNKSSLISKKKNNPSM